MKAGVVLIMLVIIGSVLPKITFQTTPSMVHSVYWRTTTMAQKGDRVNFLFRHKYVLNNKEVWFAKTLRCVEGDVLKNDGFSVMCNDELLGFAPPVVIQGETIRPLAFYGEIPKGKGFVMGESPNSFDSRYWGFIDLDSAIKIIPII
jgi:conjugal transfer pilin signal peptidase TrbI